jgi:tRNA (guanosine-2'-O-)-methyltransferase
VTQLSPTDLKRLHRRWREHTNRRLAVICDGLASPANLGSIIRTSAAYRVDDLWCCGPTPAIDTSSTQKVAMGTDRYLAVHRTETTAEALTDARANGYRIVALELASEANPLHERTATDDIALVVGHEDHGINKAVLAACDEAVYLPQLGKVGSLNVAVSTAIALYELRRTEW